MPIVFLITAVEDLTAIRAFIVEHNPTAAQQVALRLRDSVARLATFPSLGKAGRIAGTREWVTPAIGQTVYLIVYRVTRDRLEILRILHGARDLDRLLLGSTDEDEPKQS